MKRHLYAALFVAGAMTLPFTIGCDEKVAETEDVKIDDGKVTKTDTDITRQADGDLVEKKTTEVEKIDKDND